MHCDISVLFTAKNKTPSINQHDYLWYGHHTSRYLKIEHTALNTPGTKFSRFRRIPCINILPCLSNMNLLIQFVAFLANKLQRNRRGNQEWTIQGNWQHWEHNSQEDRQNKNTICVGHHHTQEARRRQKQLKQNKKHNTI